MNTSAKKIKRIVVLSLLLSGAPAIFILLGIPGWWIYEELALQKGFGTERPAGVKVEQITKPYTVTFSNGKTVDVGATPAVVSNLFHFGIGIPSVICYWLFLHRGGPAWFRSGKWQRRGVSIADD